MAARGTLEFSLEPAIDTVTVENVRARKSFHLVARPQHVQTYGALLDRLSSFLLFALLARTAFHKTTCRLVQLTTAATLFKFET